jgi:predicted ATPase
VSVIALHHFHGAAARVHPGFVEGPAAGASPVLLGETVLRLAAALGGGDGTLMVLEDLHWSCADTLAVIEYLADGAAMERLLIVGTARPEGEVLGVIDSLERRAAPAVRTLTPLRPAEVGEMTAACLDVDPEEVPGRLARVLESRAEGVPFLVEELLASIATSRALIRSASGWELDGPLESVEVPLSFAQTVHERLRQLPPLQRRTLQVAATLGRDFDWSHLPRMTGTGEADVLEALAAAVDVQLVDDAGATGFAFAMS